MFKTKQIYLKGVLSTTFFQLGPFFTLKLQIVSPFLHKLERKKKEKKRFSRPSAIKFYMGGLKVEKLDILAIIRFTVF